jgi:hypothetical protein
MFRVTVICEGIDPTDWPDAMVDVAEEFRSRPWNKIIDCHWDGNTLVLMAISDYDHNGEALADEFSDTVAAYAPGARGFAVRIRSVTTEHHS